MGGQSSSSTWFGLLRHGQTVWNQQRRIQGRADSPLTEQGITSCRQWADYLAAATEHGPWNRIVASPVPRARVSATIINRTLHLPMEEDDELREQDWGLWEGLSIPEVNGEFPGRLEEEVRRGWSFRPPRGESRLEVRRRAEAALIRLAKKYPGQRILIVSHLGVIKALLYGIAARAYLPDEPKLIFSNRLHIIACHQKSLSAIACNISSGPAP